MIAYAGYRIGRGIDPQSLPVFKKEGKRIVFKAISDPEFHKNLIGCTNSVEYFPNDSVFIILRIYFSPERNQAFWLLVTLIASQTIDLGANGKLTGAACFDADVIQGESEVMHQFFQFLQHCFFLCHKKSW